MNIQEAIKSDPDFASLFHYGAKHSNGRETSILVFSLAKRHDVHPALVTDLYIASREALAAVEVEVRPYPAV